MYRSHPTAISAIAVTGGWLGVIGLMMPWGDASTIAAMQGDGPMIAGLALAAAITATVALARRSGRGWPAAGLGGVGFLAILRWVIDGSSWGSSPGFVDAFGAGGIMALIGLGTAAICGTILAVLNFARRGSKTGVVLTAVLLGLGHVVFAVDPGPALVNMNASIRGIPAQITSHEGAWDTTHGLPATWRATLIVETGEGQKLSHTITYSLPSLAPLTRPLGVASGQ
jgi:hypothetical protein